MDIKKGKYRHYKGKEYEVLGVVKHSETLEDMVLYTCLYVNDLADTWVRPLEMFIGDVVVDGKSIPRFLFIEELT